MNHYRLMGLLVLLVAGSAPGCAKQQPPLPSPPAAATPNEQPSVGLGVRQLPLLSPFDVELLRKTSFAPGRDGFDPALPGYHLVADIGGIKLTPRKAPVDATTHRVTDVLILRIATSPGMPPMLEGFTITSERGSLQTFLSKEGPPADTEIRARDGKTQIVSSPRYVEMKVVDKTVEVRLLPPAMEWLKNGGTIQWVDWYR